MFLFPYTSFSTTKISSIIKNIVFFVYAILTVSNSYAQKTSPSPTLLIAYQECEKLDFIKARKILITEEQKTAMNFVLQSFVDVLDLLLDEDAKNYANLAKNEELYLTSVEKLTSHAQNDIKTYSQAEIKLHWAFIHLKYGHEWRAFRNFRSAFKILTQVEKINPHSLDMQKSLGLLYLLLSATPDKYQWALTFLGLEGNAKKGLQYLQNVANNPQEFRAKEAQWLLILVQTFVFKKPQQALHTLQKYQIDTQIIDEKQNLLHQLVGSWIYLKIGQAKKAQQILNITETKTFAIQHYLLAESLLLCNQLPKAEKSYLLYLQKMTGNTYLKDSYYKLFIINYLLDNEVNSKKYFDIILTQGNTNTVADRYAQQFAEKKILPNKELLLVRLLTDGGELQEAYQKLTQMNIALHPNKTVQQEYYYRKARILHKQNQLTEALETYKRVLSFQNLQTYFAPNSLLQLAYIYKEQGNTSLAKQYLQKLNQYTQYEYETSINEEAKQLMKQL